MTKQVATDNPDIEVIVSEGLVAVEGAPCPFCGGVGSLTETPGKFFRIECDTLDCGCFTGVAKTPKEAWQKWNRRVCQQ